MKHKQDESVRVTNVQYSDIKDDNYTMLVDVQFNNGSWMRGIGVKFIINETYNAENDKEFSFETTMQLPPSKEVVSYVLKDKNVGPDIYNTIENFIKKVPLEDVEKRIFYKRLDELSIKKDTN